MPVAQIELQFMQGTRWQQWVESLDCYFQPIANFHTGTCIGYEVTLAGKGLTDDAALRELCDAACHENRLQPVSRMLIEKVIRRFIQIPSSSRAQLLLKFDNRVLQHAPALYKHLKTLQDSYGVDPSQIVFVTSETPGVALTSVELASCLCGSQLKLAIANFGTGALGATILLDAQPSFVKVDRYFISESATNPKKRLLLSHLANIAHLTGALVIADQVETEAEYYSCREVGCDLLQGELVQKPTNNLAALLEKYAQIESLSQRDRRRHESMQRLLFANVESLPVVQCDTSMSEIFELFRTRRQDTFFPVVNERREPLGIIREVHMKKYVYAQFGKDILQRKSLRTLLPELLSTCSVADVHSRPEKILGMFSSAEQSEGIIMVKDSIYVGFLSAKSLVKVIHEANLALARDQNPLTKLSGNYMIYEYLAKAIEQQESALTLVYWDFDNFKPFNDTYGFRSGDRVIVFFAELLQRAFMKDNCFIGHIGGDDFFVGLRGVGLEQAQHEVSAVAETFRRDVETFYAPQDRQNGYIDAVDRDGNPKRFGLLTVSAALVELKAGPRDVSVDQLSTIITELKKKAKHASSKIAVASLPK